MPIAKTSKGATGDTAKKLLSPSESAELLRVWKARFEGNMHRHPGLHWAEVQAKLEVNAEKLWSLNEMEKTGGEPDVVGYVAEARKFRYGDLKLGQNTFSYPKTRRRVASTPFSSITTVRKPTMAPGGSEVRSESEFALSTAASPGSKQRIEELMNRGTVQSILRWAHIVLGIPIIGYIYSPFEELPKYAPRVRLFFLPLVVLLGLWMWKGHVVRRLASKRSVEHG